MSNLDVLLVIYRQSLPFSEYLLNHYAIVTLDQGIMFFVDEKEAMKYAYQEFGSDNFLIRKITNLDVVG